MTITPMKDMNRIISMYVVFGTISQKLMIEKSCLNHMYLKPI